MWLEYDGATYDIGVAVYEVAAIVIHALWLIEMSQQIEIDVTCRLFHTQQNVVDMLCSALQRMLRINHRLFFQNLARVVEHHCQCHHK